MIRKKQWHKHGDHKLVQEYDELIIGRYPVYADYGYVQAGGNVMQVRPSDWIVETVIEGVVWDIHVYPDGEH